MTQITNHVLIAAPIGEPVTVEDAREHCRIDGNHEDNLLRALVTSAREHVEAYTGRSLVSTTWELRMEYFPLSITLPKAPVSSVAQITYIDQSGAQQTLAANAYQLVVDGGIHAQAGRVFKAYDQTWPMTRGHLEDVRVRYVAGYGTPNDVPQSIKAAIRLMVGHLYENREATTQGNLGTLPLGVSALLAPFVVY